MFSEVDAKSLIETKLQTDLSINDFTITKGLSLYLTNILIYIEKHCKRQIRIVSDSLPPRPRRPYSAGVAGVSIFNIFPLCFRPDSTVLFWMTAPCVYHTLFTWRLNVTRSFILSIISQESFGDRKSLLRMNAVLILFKLPYEYDVYS